MDRLTKIIQDGPIKVLCVLQSESSGVGAYKEWSMSRDDRIRKALERLAAYEDTLLTPQEFRETVDWVLERCKFLKGVKDFDRLRKLNEADKDGLCVILPHIKVGDTIYEVDPKLAVCKVIGVSYAMGMSETWGLVVLAEVIDGYGVGNRYEYFDYELGQIWFLTREAAEMAIKSVGSVLKSVGDSVGTALEANHE